VCCCVLLYVVVCCCMLLYVVVCCCMLLYVVVCCCMLLYVAVCCCMLLYVVVYCCMLLFVVICCYVLLCGVGPQCITTYNNIQQHTTTYNNIQPTFDFPHGGCKILPPPMGGGDEFTPSRWRGTYFRLFVGPIYQSYLIIMVYERQRPHTTGYMQFEVALHGVLTHFS